MVLVLLLFSASPYHVVQAKRPQHRNVDLFPQGDFANSGTWDVGAETSFTQESATYTESMVADQRLTMLHTRPLHLDTLTVWSSTSPTDSNYSTGAPDGASTWSSGPEIELTDFDVSGLVNYDLHELHMVVCSKFPMRSRKTPFEFVQHADGFDLLKTFVNTQGNVDYINNSAFKINITALMDWTWMTSAR